MEIKSEKEKLDKHSFGASKGEDGWQDKVCSEFCDVIIFFFIEEAFASRFFAIKKYLFELQIFFYSHSNDEK